MAHGTADYWGGIQIGAEYSDTQVPVATDEHGNLFTLLKGHYAGAPKIIAVDTNGNLYALMQGAHNSVLKTIAVDTDGIMKANLSVQDLDFLTVRPAYGEAARLKDSTTITAGSTVSLFIITGRGVILSGDIYWGDAVNNKSSLTIEVQVEDALIFDWTPYRMLTRGLVAPMGGPCYVRQYQEFSGYAYAVGLSPYFTFESKLEVLVANPYGVDESVAWEITYALVP